MGQGVLINLHTDWEGRTPEGRTPEGREGLRIQEDGADGTAGGGWRFRAQSGRGLSPSVAGDTGK